MGIVRSLYAKTERGDFSFLDREPELRDFFARDFEWHTREDLPDAGIRRGNEGLACLGAEWRRHAGEAYRGVDAWVRAAEAWLEPCEWMVVDLEQIVDADDCVVALHRTRIKMRHTGLEFEMPLAYVYTLKDGRVVHSRAFADHGEALAAVGLTG